MNGSIPIHIPTVMISGIGIAKPGEVHGVYNSGPEDILILSVLAPLPIEIEEVPGFNYPE